MSTAPNLSRRQFLCASTAAASAAAFCQAAAAAAAAAADGPKAARPNIVWIVAEDMSPDIGCYGDELARTPNLDRLAAEGTRFARAFTHAPVCAPSRSGLITGCYPTTLGSHHMRSKLVTPPPTFTEFLKRAGYHTVWPGKTDFNFDPRPGWVDSKADWTKDPGALPRPFFAYHNINVTHESQTRANPQAHARNTRNLTPGQRQDPAKMKLPPFYPDDPDVRADLVRYYEDVTAMDHEVGRVLAAIDRAGLREDTLVIFFGDHGRGMPRYKRWCYDTGLRVGMIARWPGKLAAGSVRDDLVAFIDLAPTVLTLAGAPVPEHMQGRPMLNADGSRPAEECKYVFGARDRMDETFDRIRSVRDKRWRYVRNFRPDLPYAQEIVYNEQNPTMRAWRRAHEAGTLTGPAAAFFAKTKRREELYDSENDPYEVNNLADSTDPVHVAKLQELRAALDRWIVETRDLGEVDERELIRRGVVKDVLGPYEERKKQHKEQPAGATPAQAPR